MNEEGTYALSPVDAGVTTSHITSEQKEQKTPSVATSRATEEEDSQRLVSTEDTGPLGYIRQTREWEIRR